MNHVTMLKEAIDEFYTYNADYSYQLLDKASKEFDLNAFLENLSLCKELKQYLDFKELNREFLETASLLEDETERKIHSLITQILVNVRTTYKDKRQEVDWEINEEALLQENSSATNLKDGFKALLTSTGNRKEYLRIIILRTLDSFDAISDGDWDKHAFYGEIMNLIDELLQEIYKEKTNETTSSE